MINNVQTIHFLRRQKHTRNERELPHKNMSAYALNTVEGLKYLGKKFTLVNVQISSANTTSLDFDLSNCIACQQDFLRSVKRQRLQVNPDSENKNSGDAYQDIVLAKSGHRNLDDLEFLWLRVSASKTRKWCLALRGNNCT